MCQLFNVTVILVSDLAGNNRVGNCQATNETTSETTLCSVPNITKLNFYYFVTIQSGNNRTFSCEIQSSTPLKGVPVWRREYPQSLPKGYIVENDSCSSSADVTCIVSNFTLTNVVQHQSDGNYTLTAENDCGSAAVYVDVVIWGKSLLIIAH